MSGKGGVGKTTVSAVLADAASADGRRVLLVDVEGKNTLATLFGADDIGYDIVNLADGVEGRTINAEQALLEFLDDHNLHWVAKRLQSMNLLEIVATAAPGLKDILVLGKVKQIEQRGIYDLIIVDGPAAGHAVSFLGSAAGLEDAVRVGPILSQARDVNAMLTDPDRTTVILVALPEETPVNEAIEATAVLRELRISVSGLIVNGWYPAGDDVAVEQVAKLGDAAQVMIPNAEVEALSEAAHFRAIRNRLQQMQLERLETILDLPILELPYLFTADFGLDEVRELARRLERSIRPKKGRPKKGRSQRGVA